MIRIKTYIEDNIRRIEAWEKVTGEAKYADDLSRADQLVARILSSPHAHAKIISVDVSKALALPGVKAAVTGKDYPVRCGALIEDRPPLARDRVLYAGEPVALVVALSEAIAAAAVQSIEVIYEPLPFVLTPTQSLAQGAPILHEEISGYRINVDNVYPQPDINIASQYKTRKGDAKAALEQCAVTVEQSFYLPPSAHCAMEIRTACAFITPDGEVCITTSSQAPYAVQEQIAGVFGIPAGKIRIKVPYVGGAFGGKVSAVLEFLAYIATKAVGGRPVRVMLSREQDIASAPSRLCLEATVKLGATKEGKLQAAEMTYRLDCGAYADSSPHIAMAMAANGTGPYNVENLSIDALCVYTNRTFATSYRGFGHESYLFCVERAMDALSKACGIDPLEFRFLNAIQPGHLTPTQVECTASNAGDIRECIHKLKVLSNWDEGISVHVDERTVRAKGLACFWKAANPPSNACSGSLITFNQDGSVNLNVGVTEMGNGDQTRLSQMLADKLNLNVGMVHVIMEVDTRAQPKHWKTVASLGEYLAGHAVMRAAEDAIRQIKEIAAQALHCMPENIEIGDAKAFSKSNPKEFFHFKELVNGYKAPDQASIGDPVLGRGGFMLKGLSNMEQETGRGKSGPSWTVGAQVVEIELDLVDYTYRLVNADTVIDIGALNNPKFTAEMIKGGVSMGLSLASRESFPYDPSGIMSTPNFRTYKLLHIGQEPDYRVEFVTTPQLDAPFGMRSFTEHGILGVPAALANALATAIGKEILTLPITPEVLWKAAGGAI